MGDSSPRRLVDLHTLGPSLILPSNCQIPCPTASINPLARFLEGAIEAFRQIVDIGLGQAVVRGNIGFPMNEQ